MTKSTRAATLVALLALGAAAPALRAQSPTRYVISIGDYPNVVGLRLNFRDSDLERVVGVNATIWSPYEPARGVVKGIALGLPVTGAGDIHGLATGLLGVGASHDISGLAVAPVGLGAGGSLRGIAIGGIGVGAGGGGTGILLGGIGAGMGGSFQGIGIGGVGVGAGGNVRGALLGGVGVGAGGDIEGLLVGGVGVGAGGNVRGIVLGGVGAGAGGNVTGLAIGGVGIGAGGTIHGVAIGGVGVGAPRLEGLFLGTMVGAEHANAFVIAPAMLRIEKDGSFRGGSISTVNYIRGAQHGIVLGIVNYARRVDGVQVGLVNIISESRSHPFLPLLNWGN